jgi:uncharacterized membrane protein
MVARSRLPSLDALRGLVMIIMALDHVRDFVHSSAMASPEDLTRTTPILFFTRWITHFCAPVFMFAGGAGAFLMAQRNPAKLSRFLWTRGLWLIVLEVTVMRVAYYFSFDLKYPTLLIVLWALGCSMISLALLSKIPIPTLAVISLLTIATHNAFDGVKDGALWTILHRPGPVVLGPAVLMFGYPLIPWIDVMATGFCFGRVLLLPPDARRRFLLRTGTALTLAFLVLRSINIYGDPSPWSSKLYPVLSFLRCTKYPPSLDYLLMTLGPALLCLAWLDNREWKPANPLIVFGRVPLFYFIVHFFAAHAIANIMETIRYRTTALMFVPPPNMGGPMKLFPADYGFDLWVVYLVWATLVIALYPLCRWFAALKARRTDWWLSYL